MDIVWAWAWVCGLVEGGGGGDGRENGRNGIRRLWLSGLSDLPPSRWGRVRVVCSCLDRAQSDLRSHGGWLERNSPLTSANNGYSIVSGRGVDWGRDTADISRETWWPGFGSQPRCYLGK